MHGAIDYNNPMHISPQWNMVGDLKKHFMYWTNWEHYLPLQLFVCKYIALQYTREEMLWQVDSFRPYQ